MNSKSGMYIGVVISVVIVLVIIGAVVLLPALRGHGIGTPSKNTTDPGKLDKIELNIDLARIIHVPSGSGAEAAYHEVVRMAVAYGDEFMEAAGKPRLENDQQREKLITRLETERKDTADKLESGGNFSERQLQNMHKTLEAIEEKKDYWQKMEIDEKFNAMMKKLDEAADMGMGDAKLVFSSLPAMSPKTSWKICGTFYAIAQVAEGAVLTRMQAGDVAGAEKAARAMLLWGYRLHKNGDDFVAYKYGGIRCISLGFGGLEMVHMKTDAGKLATTKELYQEYRQTAGDRWFEKGRIVLTVPPLKINSADLWNMTENDKDRAWRLEGVMWLGVSQWTSAIGKQRTGVQSYLESLTRSKDPQIAKLAKEARAMTRDDVHEVAFNLPR